MVNTAKAVPVRYHVPSMSNILKLSHSESSHPDLPGTTGTMSKPGSAASRLRAWASWTWSPSEDAPPALRGPTLRRRHWDPETLRIGGQTVLQLVTLTGGLDAVWWPCHDQTVQKLVMIPIYTTSCATIYIYIYQYIYIFIYIYILIVESL